MSESNSPNPEPPKQLAVVNQKPALTPLQYLEMAQAAEKIGESYAVLAGLPKACGPAVMMVCMQEGMSPVDFVRTYHIIDGKPTMRADAMLARLNQSGWDHEVVETSPQRACIKIWKRSEPATSVQNWEMTREQAEASRWPWVSWRDHSKGKKDNWATDEDMENMLWCRLVSKMARKVDPSIVAGLYTPQEMSDAIDVEFKVQPANPAATPLTPIQSAMQVQENPPAEEPPFDPNEAEDADYEVVHGDSAAVPVASTPVTTPPAAAEPALSQSQMNRILELWAELELTDEQAKKQVTSRGANILAELRESKAKDLLERLELFKASKSKN